MIHTREPHCGGNQTNIGMYGRCRTREHHVQRKLTCSSLNVCSLRSKLLIPEFCDSILKYDMFACLETKLDELDQINVDGYKFISKPRKQKVLRKSGGIGIFVKNSIHHLLTEIPTECEYVLWFKINRNLFNAAEDVYFGTVYVPPDNTKFFSREIFDMFCNEVDHFTTNNQYVVLLDVERCCC